MPWSGDQVPLAFNSAVFRPVTMTAPTESWRMFPGTARCLAREDAPSRNCGAGGGAAARRLPAIVPALLGALVSQFAATASAEGGFTDWVEYSGRITTEAWHYPDSATYPDQRSYAGGLALETTVYMEDDAGRSITFTPFIREDAGDSARSQVEIREAYLLSYGDIGDDEWEWRLGVDQVHWGVVESRSLVDIVNQTDIATHPNEKTKLGQLMAHYTLSGEWGALEIFGMTRHRGRTYPGSHGRQRTELVVDRNLASYESGAKEWHIDLAGRYSGRFGPVDLGLSLFDGTNREPVLSPALSSSHQIVLAPHYEQIRQYGLDAQLTTGSLLLKLEAIHRTGAKNNRFDQHFNFEEEDFSAYVAGGEYTFSSVWDSNADLVLFAEWLHDDRGQRATNAFENDLFLAARLGLNDVQSTEFVVSLLASLENSSYILGGEFKRRLGDNWFLHCEVSTYHEIDPADAVYTARRDSFARVNLDYNF